ncbi:MAG TPA: sodium:proton antiporter [Solirubrobacterales bacterium]|jgi:NhaP-type Na+/H+ or K+/H+ antiporter|nr:sodium:proton antiporter [Solirubrobacterales bacterium]
MDLGFGEAVLLFGGLLAIVAALSGLMKGTVLSASVLSVALGILLAATGVVHVDATDQSIVELIELALILTLFSDGMFVERELLRRHWSPVARALTIAMPITMALLGLAAKALFPQLSWAEALLLGAVLSPTDPVVTSAVVTSRLVPSAVRHTLNLESGLNDGLALPFVLFFLVLATPGGDAGTEAAKLAGEAVVGAIIGFGLGAIGGRLHHHLPGGGLTQRYEGIYAVGFALVAFGLAEVTFGNGLIAAFVCGIAMAAVERDVPQGFVEFAENTSAILQVLTFFVFGALIVATGFHHSIPPLILFVLFALIVARPAAVILSFIRTGIPRPQKLFMAWFGPKGVASMLFALFVLKSGVGNGELIFDVAAIAIIASIVAHGLTDTLGARWMARRVGLSEGSSG